MPGTPDVEAVQRRTLRVLLASQTLAGAGLSAGITVGALLAEDMLGSTGSSGVPAALFTVGSAAAAVGVGRLSQAAGRRPGLATGYAVGAFGGALVVLAAAVDSVPLLFCGLLLYGSGSATNLQARYAGADLAPPERRGRALSLVLFATTLGAVAGPNLADPMGGVADGLGLPRLAGPFLLATVAYALGGLAVQLALRPDPLLTARRLAVEDPAPAGSAAAGPATTAQGTLWLGIAGMVMTQLVMIAIMTMTPVHMADHGHGLGAAGVVISIHVAAMFVPAPLSGRLVDRFGPRPVLAGAGGVLLSAGVVAGLAPEDSVAVLAVALALLGLGWSLGLVAGTTMVTAAAPLASRARTQGTADVFVALAGATGGLGSGFVVAASSFAALAFAGAALSLLLVPLALRAAQRPA